IDFITINIYLKHLKQKKLFLISLFVSSVGFLYRWYYNIYSIFTSKKWR
ncbi:glycosyl transferase family 2, partial [Odoribacter sp. OF09-27XD]